MPPPQKSMVGGMPLELRGSVLFCKSQVPVSGVGNSGGQNHIGSYLQSWCKFIFLVIVQSKTAGDRDLQVLENILIPAYYREPEGLSQAPC